MKFLWLPFVWEPMMLFFSWGQLARVSLAASVATEDDLEFLECASALWSGLHPAVAPEDGISNPSAKGYKSSNTVSSVSFSSGLKSLSAVELTLEGTTRCFVTAATGTKVSISHRS